MSHATNITFNVVSKPVTSKLTKPATTAVTPKAINSVTKTDTTDIVTIREKVTQATVKDIEARIKVIDENIKANLKLAKADKSLLPECVAKDKALEKELNRLQTILKTYTTTSK